MGHGMPGSWLETINIFILAINVALMLISAWHALSSTLYPKYDITRSLVGGMETRIVEGKVSLVGVNNYDITITLVNGGPGVAKDVRCEVRPLNSNNKDECKNACSQLELEVEKRSKLPALAPNGSYVLWKGSCEGEASFMVKVCWRKYDVPEWLPYFVKKYAYASESFCFDKFGSTHDCDECIDLLE
jgi:hypothetical protein